MTELTQEILQAEVIYHQDSGAFEWAKRGKGRYKALPGSVHKQTGYVYMSVLGKKYLAHRLAWLYAHGEWPTNKIDHKNGDKMDNRIDNLRNASDAINSQNQRKPMARNKIGLLGVSMHGSGFRAQIKVNYQRVGLGSFKSAELAHDAYVSAKRQLHAGCTL